ncbi:MAG: hypothetical protein J5787_05420 [Alphaproteobacteria bacterium]|nr:hypothetical protein [Alphaproteobacteria bacterium]
MGTENVISAQYNQPKKEEGKLIDDVIAGVKVQYANEEEKEKLTKILEKLKEIPTGQETLKNLAEYGTTVALESINGFGVQYPSQNRIVLNIKTKNEKLCSTLVHEARHATQTFREKNGKISEFGCDFQSKIKWDRAKEADAQVFAYQAACEWAAAGDPKPLEEFRKYYPVTDEYYRQQKSEKHFEDGTDEARSVLFRAFFEETNRLISYENLYLNKKAFKDLADCICHKPVSGMTGRGAFSLTNEQIASVTCGEYMADYDAFLNSDKAISVAAGTKDILTISSAVKGWLVTVDKLPVSSTRITQRWIDEIEKSPIGGIHKVAAEKIMSATGLKDPADVEALYYDSVEKQAETVQSFSPEMRETFKRGKIASKFIRYFCNGRDISEAEKVLQTTSDEEKRAAAQKIIDEKTAENADLRDYVTVAAFIEKNRRSNPELIARALASPELSESVKKELRFDNEALCKPSEKEAAPLTKKEQALLIAMRKGSSRPLQEDGMTQERTVDLMIESMSPSSGKGKDRSGKGRPHSGKGKGLPGKPWIFNGPHGR